MKSLTGQTCLMVGETPSESGLVIYGAGGMGQELADTALASGGRVRGFIDDDQNLAGSLILGLPVVGDRKWLSARRAPVVIGIGSPSARRRVWDELASEGAGEPAALVHPTAYVGLGCRLGAGAVVSAGAVLTADVELGRFVIVNAGATVSHNCHLADFATVAPGAHLAGNIRVEEGADIGIGASVIQGRVVGAWSIVGAGAVVIRDVERNTTVAGCPARVISEREEGWQGDATS